MATMDIIQIPLTDQQIPVNNIRTRTFFVVHDHLDEDVLRNGLDRLIRDHWRKLGARLIIRPKDGFLEYHLPRTFEEKYVLFNWTSQEFDYPIDKNTGLPKATPSEDGITLLPPLTSFEESFRPSDWPLEMKGQPHDAPMLYVHMSLFADATVIAVSYPHVLGDQLGLANIMKAWLGLIKGDAPPPMAGVDTDILPNEKSYADYPKKEVVRKGKVRVRGKMEDPLVILAFLPDFILHPKEDKFIVFLPQPLVDSLRQRHSKALVEKYGADPGITNNDIITGILLKLSRMHHKTAWTMSLSQTLNLRGRIPELTENRDAFIHNSLLFSTARFRMGPSTPLSELAYQNRLAHNSALDKKYIDISLVVTREMVRRGQGSHVCEPFDHSFHFTSWNAAWRGLDFSPALKEPVEGGGDRTLPKLFVMGLGKVEGGPDRYSPTLFCKSADGYWVNFGVPPKTTALIREYLKKNPTLENF